MSRVHWGGFPDRHAAVLAEALAGVDDVPGSTAEAAAADDACVAYVGPFRSRPAAWDAPVLNEAGIVQVCPATTWVGLTRDEPGADDEGVAALRPSGRPTLVRLAMRDMVVCRAILANAPEHRLAVVAEHGEYGEQLAAQLRLAGHREEPGEPDAVVYCGLAEGAPHGLLAGKRVYAFDGAQGFGDAQTRYVLPLVPRPGWDDDDVLAYVPNMSDAGELVARALAQAQDREGVLRAVWELGGFDEHGDPPDGPIGVWRTDLTLDTTW